jgi:hypothetical protein
MFEWERGGGREGKVGGVGGGRNVSGGSRVKS